MNKIYEIRQLKGMSLEAVAKACVPETTAKQISRLEKGERRLTTEWIDRLAKAMDCHPSEIVPEFAQSVEVQLYDLLDRAAQEAEKRHDEFTSETLKMLMERQKK